MPKEIKIGFIGFGNMAQAMARGFLRAGDVPGAQIFACAKHWDKLTKAADALGINPCGSAEEVIRDSDLIIAAVKPHLMEEVLAPVRKALAEKVVLSVASGWDFDKLERLLGRSIHHISCMPNTPVAVGEGVVLLEDRHSLNDREYASLLEVLAPLGLVLALPAPQKDAAGILTGCGPAWAAMFIEALADAGVAQGLPRSIATRLAAQMLAGTGKLQLDSGDSPAALKDAVCSPGGTTIAGVKALERAGFRAAALDAVDAVVARKKELN